MLEVLGASDATADLIAGVYSGQELERAEEPTALV